MVIARTGTCEWCTVVFSKPNPAHVHHLEAEARAYKLGPGDFDWFAYMSMIDTHVAVICSACHRTWSELGKRRVPPRPCVECGDPTSAPGGACSNACSMARLTRANPRRAREVRSMRLVHSSRSEQAQNVRAASEIRDRFTGTSSLKDTLRKAEPAGWAPCQLAANPVPRYDVRYAA